MKVNKDFSYKEVNLLSYNEFKKRCKFFFDCYADSNNNGFNFTNHYYCGEGSFSFSIFNYSELNKDITIVQNDYYQETCYKLYSGFGSKEKYIGDFITLTNALNYIIANDLIK